MKFLKTALIYMCLFLVNLPAWAAPIVVDVSDPLIEVDTQFRGRNIVIFGAREGSGDVAILLKGPQRNVEVRQKEQNALGIWYNTRRVIFPQTPLVYHVATSRPLSQLANKESLNRASIGLENITLLPQEDIPPHVRTAMADAFLKDMTAHNLYSEAPQPISFQGGMLFRTNIRLPADIPTGTYTVEAYLFEEGTMSHAQLKTFVVRKVGFSEDMTNFAHNNSFFYGLIAICMGLAFGLLSSLRPKGLKS